METKAWPEVANVPESQTADYQEQAAWWRDHDLHEGWKLGEYTLYAIEFPAAEFRSLYVRSISDCRHSDDDNG